MSAKVGGGNRRREVPVVEPSGYRLPHNRLVRSLALSQNEPVPIVALLQEIRTQLPWYSKALAESKKLGEIVMRSALLSLDDLTKKIGLQAATVKTIQETGEKWEQENLATSLPAHMIRAHLDHALGQLLGRATSPGGTPTGWLSSSTIWTAASRTPPSSCSKESRSI